MKYILLVSILGIGSFVGATQAEQTVVGPLESDLKISELASLPQGLTVVHTPDPVERTFSGPSGFQWTHSTTVSSTVGPVTIVEFGCFYEDGGRWTFGTGTKAPFTAEDFAEWYGCAGATLQPGESYTDAHNRSLGNFMPEQVTKWYFIGLDSQGNRVKGEAGVTLLSDPSQDGC